MEKSEHKHHGKRHGKKIIITIVVLSVIGIMLLLSGCGGASISKADLQVLGGLPGRIDAQDTAINNQGKRITTAENDIAGLKNGTSVDLAPLTAADAALKASDDALSLSLDGLNKTVQDQSLIIEDLTSRLEEAEGLIAEISAPAEASYTEPVTVEVKTLGNILLYADTNADPDQLDNTFRVTFKNNTSKPVDSLLVWVSLKPYPSLPSITAAFLTGGTTTWTTVYKNPNSIVFQNQKGINLAAGESKSITFALHLEVGDVTSNTAFDLEVIAES